MHTMLSEIKTSMRISHNTLDSDILRNIDTCLLDLRLVGVNESNESNLLTKACELYCKWQYDYQGKGEQFQKNYEKLRDSMSLCSEYMESDSNV